MPTILLEQIIELLTGWKDSFFTWANGIGDKIASIKTNTDSLPDIKANTDDIKDNTAAVITPISNINTNVSSISSDTASIRTDAGIIKNNAQAIATSSGQAAAYAQDVANNTLEVKNKVTTIASDTTQMRADSGSIRADVSEIKNTLGLYLYNTIVTEDAEGPIANCDTDLQDYLQNAVVTIPADVGGISGININKCGKNLFPLNVDINDSDYVHAYTPTLELKTIMSKLIGKTIYCSSDYTGTNSGVQIGQVRFLSGVTNVFDINPNMSKVVPNVDFSTINQINVYGSINGATIKNIQFELGNAKTSYEEFKKSTDSITFTAPITDGAEVDLLSGIVKINTSPITYDSITPLAIRTFKGVNNIYSDIGDMDVTYRETLKHYLEKQENNSRSLNRNVNLLRENTESLDLSDDDSNRRI